MSRGETLRNGVIFDVDAGRAKQDRLEPLEPLGGRQLLRCILAVVGGILGLIGAALLTRVMASMLFGVSTTDAVTFSIVPLILVATAMVASYIPALRATRVDPVVALRDE